MLVEGERGGGKERRKGLTVNGSATFDLFSTENRGDLEEGFGVVVGIEEGESTSEEAQEHDSC